jgi:hypothetical protein
VALDDAEVREGTKEPPEEVLGAAGEGRVVRGAILPSVQALIPLKATRTLVTGGYLVGERQMVFGEVCTDRLLSTRYATRALCLSVWSRSGAASP